MVNESSQNPKQDWRLGAVIGLVIVASLGISKAVEKSLAPTFGDWGAFGMSLLAVVLVASVIAVFAQRFFRK